MEKSYKLTEQEYNYLLPALKHNLLYSSNRHYFIGSFDNLIDMINRLQGCYDVCISLNSMTAYICSKNGCLDYFRKQLLK